MIPVTDTPHAAYHDVADGVGIAGEHHGIEQGITAFVEQYRCLIVEHDEIGGIAGCQLTAVTVSSGISLARRSAPALF